MIRQPNYLVQDRLEGVPKYTERQRARKLRETLAKSKELTENLLRRMDKDSEDEEDGNQLRQVNRGNQIKRKRGDEDDMSLSQGLRSHLHFTVKMTPPKIASNFIIAYFLLSL